MPNFLLLAFFKKHIGMAASVILVDLLLTKHSVIPEFKKTGVDFRSKFVKEKEAYHLKLTDIYLQAIGLWRLVCDNKYSLSYLIINLLTI